MPSRPAGRPVLEYLPELYHVGGGVLEAFLAPVQAMLDELDAAVAGAPDGTGGLPDLVDPATTPPPQLPYRGGDPFAFLSYLAGWLAIPLRPEKPLDWNRRYLARAIELASQRGTLPGVAGLLRAWLQGDVLDGSSPDADPPAPPASSTLVLTDLSAPVNGVDTAFQLGAHSLLGLETVLGHGPASFFIVDLIVDPTVPDLHDPVGLDALQRSTRSLLDAERPVSTGYELRVRGQTMQLAPADPAQTRPGELYAQLEDRTADPPVTGTALLWDSPWIYGDSPLDP